MSGLFEQFADKVTSTEGTRDRVNYTLDEDLTIMDLIANETSLQEVAKLTGRSVNSLRYRYKDKNRGVRKILSTGGPAALYQQHKVPVPTDIATDTQSRIDSFKSSLNNPAA